VEPLAICCLYVVMHVKFDVLVDPLVDEDVSVQFSPGVNVDRLSELPVWIVVDVGGVLVGLTGCVTETCVILLLDVFVVVTAVYVTELLVSLGDIPFSSSDE